MGFVAVLTVLAIVLALVYWRVLSSQKQKAPAQGRRAVVIYGNLGPLAVVATVLRLSLGMLAERTPWLFKYRTTSWIAWWVHHYPSFALDMGPTRRMIATHDPESLKYILSTNFSNYIRPDVNTDVLSVFLGDGIFNSNGKNWKFQRETSHPFFRGQHINEHMTPVFVHHTEVLCRKLEEAANSGEIVDLQNLLSRYTLDTFLEVAFGLRVSCLEDDIPFNGCFNRIITELTTREENPLYPLLWWRKRPFEQDLATVNEFVGAIIAEHKSLSREELQGRKGLLSRFMLLETDPALTEQFLRDITVNFLLAGRDTTAQTLLWTTYFISQAPVVEGKLLEELDKLEITGVPSSPNILHRMKYHKQVLNEGLRVIPPVPLEGRQAINDDVLPNGTFVPAGWIVAYLAPLYHRMKSLWGEDADIFDPERWAGKRKEEIRPYQFLAFHGGEQRCLGEVLAYQEMKVALAGMMGRFHFELAMPSDEVVATRGLTVSAKYGMLFKIRPRKDFPMATLLQSQQPLPDLSKRDRYSWK